MTKKFIFIGVVCYALLTMGGASQAFTVQGKLVNGTTSRPADARVIVVRPSGGMQEEQVVDAVGGMFVIDGLDETAPIYLLRVDYQGVMYNEPLRFDGSSPMEVTITIYETMDTWSDQIHITIPHLTARRSEDGVAIERLFEISNHTNPPRTIAGEDVQFRIRLPEDMLELNGVFVSALGVPIERTPIETDVPNVFRIDYPVRPGAMRVGVSFKVPYEEGTYTLREKLLYDIDEMTLFAVDPDMEISSNVKLTKGDGAHGMVSYKAASLAAGTDLEIRFTGGSSAPVTANASTGGTPVVIVVPNATEKMSLVVMAVLLLALIVLAAMATRGPVDAGGEAQQLQRYRDILLRRIAKLDDLHTAEVIPTAAYHAKRAELKNQVASLVYRLRPSTTPTNSQKDSREKEKRTGVQ